MKTAIVVHPDPGAAGRAVAERVRAIASEAIRARGRFSFGLSGGRSPEPLFQALAAAPEASGGWNGWSVFWCDERLVPPDDPRSNQGLARRLWLRPAKFPASGELPVATDLTVQEAASRYETGLRALAEAGGSPEGGPALDAVLLGVGPDGHTASLFPGAASLQERSRWVVAEPNPPLDPRVARVTVSLEALAHARFALFLVWGPDKRGPLSRILDDPARGTGEASLPAGRVRARESVEWHVDRDAWPERAPPRPR